MLHIIESDSAAVRLEAAASFLRRFPPHQPITIVASTRGAADDLARAIAVERGAAIGLARFSLTQLAARVAATRLAGQGIAPATALGSVAVAARAAFDAVRGGALTYFAEVAGTPGFPRALAQTLAELRAAGMRPSAVATASKAGPDLALLLERTEQELADAETADRARLFAAAAEGVRDDRSLRAPLVLLDVAIDGGGEEQFVRALIEASAEVIATVPAHDADAAQVLRTLPSTWLEPESRGRTDAAAASNLERLRAHLFADEAPPVRDADASVTFFSAPGEGRECVEIARRVLAEARRGVPFDQMAILIRTPHQYHGLLEHALERAQVPACFDRGTRRPHPAGRAFLALMACAGERLSARRFAEYLSLGQLPPDDAEISWNPSSDEMFAHAGDAPVDDDAEEVADDVSGDADRAAIAGTLRAPRHWERMLVEAAVIGGNAERWARRLGGLESELAARLGEARRDDPESPRAAGIERDLARLQHLRAFALPLVEEMSGWPSSASWGDWLARFEGFVPRVLRAPAYVLRVLADLRPMATVGPVTLDEVRGVLSARLLMVDAEPPPRRYGRVLVATPAQIRGRAFRVVFVPGLAERMFPQKPRQDPLLPDAARGQLTVVGQALSGLPGGPDKARPTYNPEPQTGRLATVADRGRRERLLLHLAAGAATERLHVSYPRLDVAEGRVRVPSFYALDVLRGASGSIPDHETLAQAAAEAGDATLAWPAPSDPANAIDDQEHDLAVLRGLLDARDPAAVRGHAQYMLRLNPALRRSVTERWARGEKKWSQFDGIIRVGDRVRAALDRHRLGNRRYSLSALQRFSACPYQFLLAAIYRLEPAEQPQPLQRLDPLTRGSIVHRMQAVFFRTLRQRGALPIRPASLDGALGVLDEVMTAVAAEYRETLLPAIDRVWDEEIAAIGRDLRGWVRHVAADGDAWTPRYFELGFGLRIDSERDPGSAPDPVTVDGRFILHGSIDLVEEDAAGGTLRVTDHKTGKDRSREGLTIGGGATLQPVLYSLAVEQVLGKPVTESRLFFCTSAGGYKVRPVRLTPDARRLGIEALEIVDRAIETGFLAAAPAEGACTWCDFRPVCGPNEEQRVARKPVDRLRDLIELRSRP